MAQQHKPTAAAVVTDDRTHFLVQKHDGGFLSTSATFGHHKNSHSVLVWDEKNSIPGYEVVHSISANGFSYQDYLTTSEARTLAQALNMAADLADEQAAMATGVPIAEVAA